MDASPFGSGPGLVKICGLRVPEHAVAAVEAGADLLGFVFAPSKRRITAEEAALCIAAARAAADREILAVGVFVDASLDEIDRVVEVAGLDLVQLHGGETDDALSGRARPTIRALRPDPGAQPAEVLTTLRRRRDGARPPVAWHIDGYHPTAHGGTGIHADWSLAGTIAAEFPLFLAGGLTPENVGEAIRVVRPLAVDVSSGVERDGVKDPRLIAAFVEAARAAFDRR